MSKSIEEITEEIRALSSEERADLIRSLIADLDAPPDADVERAWLETAQRRCRELVSGAVKGIPGDQVFARIRSRLGG